MNQSKLNVNINNYLKTISQTKLINNNLIWLFEAISNSIFSLQDQVSEKSKKITIEFKENQTSLIPNSNTFQLGDVIVKDNGVGFNSERYYAFSELNTSFNEKNGGKGFGRMTYLLYFEEFTVNSIIYEKNKIVKKTFNVDKNQWINNFEENEISANMQETKLIFKEPLKAIELNIMEICHKIIMYFLLYFDDNLFDISIDVIFRNKHLNLNKIFIEEIKSKIEKNEKKIGYFNFCFIWIKLPIKFLENNKFFLFAHKREVESMKVDNVVEKRNFGTNNKEYNIYMGVSSKFLDDSVNQYRDKIEFNNDNKNLLKQDSSIFEKIDYKKEIKDEINTILERNFPNEINEVKKEKARVINAFFQKNKEYRDLWMDLEIKEEIIKLPENIINDDKKFKLKIYQLKIENEEKIKNDIKSKINNIKMEEKDKLLEQLERKRNLDNILITQLINSRLEDLEYFEKLITDKKDGNCVTEKEIHNFLCEINKSGKIEKLKNRLWILDESLFFRKIVSSDVPLSRNKSVAKNDIRKRPDIFVTKTTNNTNESDNVISDRKIIIFEIKRPELKNHDKGNDPNEQLIKYHDELTTKSKLDNRQRPLIVEPDAFYELISICDISLKYREKLIENEYIEEKNRGAYHKILLDKKVFSSTLSFDYILETAKERYAYLIEKIKNQEDT